MTQISIDEIRRALTQVEDPELKGNIVELGMIQNIEVNASDVLITLALTTMGCPLKKQLQGQATEAAKSVPGTENVTVRLTEMTEEQRKALKARMSPALNINHVNQMIAVMSGKGGVGKSSVTALLASSLRRKGFSVGVLDADITGPSIPRLFGVNGPVRSIPLGMFPIETNSGIKIMSTNLMLPEEDMAIVWRGPIMSGTLRQFWTDVLWGQLDFLLIDLPPGTSDITLTAMQSLPLNGVVMVSTPQSLASMVVRKTVHMAQNLKVPILGIVENMSYYKTPDGEEHAIFGESHTEAIAAAANAPLLARLPIDPALADLADCGEIEKYQNSILADLSDAFLSSVEVEVEKTGNRTEPGGKQFLESG